MASEKAEPRRPRFELLDYLRFIAAFAVVVYHWSFRGVQSGYVTSISTGAIVNPVSQIASYGYLGVELFFLISGFVIAISAQSRSAADFAVSRAQRLYPAFWVAMTLTAVVTVLWGSPKMVVTPVSYLANLTMGPSVFGQPLVDSVYWTLLNELIFYGLIFLFLIFRLGRWLDLFFPLWAVGMVLVLHLTPQFSSTPLFGGLYSLFAGGAIISTIHRQGWNWWRVVGLVASLYVAMRFTAAEVDRLNALTPPYVQSTLVTCGLVALFYVLLLIQIRPAVTRWQLPHSRLLGALTYPVYLLHAHLGYVMLNRFANDANHWWVSAVGVLLLIALAFGLHQGVEVRLRSWWSRLLEAAIGAPIRWLEGRIESVSRLWRPKKMG